MCGPKDACWKPTVPQVLEAAEIRTEDHVPGSA